LSAPPGEPLSSPRELVAFLRDGETPRSAWRIGTEHEKIGLQAASLRPIPYQGERGIGALLAAMQQAGGWQPVRESGLLIGLAQAGAAVTLEPGGQLELSGAPLRTIFETCAEFHRHLEQLRGVSEPLGLLWLSLGAHPLHDLSELPHMPKARYDIMRAYLPAHGKLALQMMHATATVQANFDYADEADMARKMRAAMGLSPIIAAIFANSPLHRGRGSGFISRRLEAWRHTDPARCGLLPFVFEEDFGYERYVEWALDVPMFFLHRAEQYLPAAGATFRSFMEHGLHGARATLNDFALHLTTLFPDVRLKQFIEVRCADAVPPALICALPALWKGILYDGAALDAAWRLVSDWTLAERESALAAVARSGLAAQVAGRPVLALARELLEISRAGLARIGHGEGEARDESGFLDPIAELLQRGRSPGEELLAHWEGGWGRDPGQLIQNARY